jgi:hypothetical protein
MPKITKELCETTIAAVRQAKGNLNEAARELGVSRGCIRGRLREAEAEFEMTWQAPVEIPTTHYSPKTTVQYDGQGNVLQEWRRLCPISNALADITEQLCKKVEGIGRVKQKTATYQDDNILQETVISDPHLGMMAWPDETGHFAYDIKIATQTVRAAIESACKRAMPKTHVLVFNGDIMHADNRKNATEHSGNVLDVDSRWSKVLEHAELCMVESVRIAAETAEKVILVVNPGNHDWHSAYALGRILTAYYKDCKNVEVLNTPRPRKTIVFGNVLLGWAHGDRVKAGDWAKIIPTEFPKEWGSTKYRYLHLGHVHHSKGFAPITVDEQSGLTVEYLRSLCPLDAWHAESGYIGSLHGCDSFLYHKDYGLDSRYFFNSESVWKK